jgi:hypothetical protein
MGEGHPELSPGITAIWRDPEVSFQPVYRAGKLHRRTGMEWECNLGIRWDGPGVLCRPGVYWVGIVRIGGLSLLAVSTSVKMNMMKLNKRLDETSRSSIQNQESR